MATAGRVSPRVRAFLRANYTEIDGRVPPMLQLLADRGAAECWHKHSTFLQHLTGVWRIMTLWGQRPEAARVSGSVRFVWMYHLQGLSWSHYIGLHFPLPGTRLLGGALPLGVLQQLREPQALRRELGCGPSPGGDYFGCRCRGHNPPLVRHRPPERGIGFVDLAICDYALTATNLSTSEPLTFCI
jgi:hypothetical protein